MKNRIKAMFAKETVRPEDYVGDNAEHNAEVVREKFVAKAKRYLRQLPMATEVVAMYFCMLDAKTPLWVKGVVGAALAYFILPIDAIPDFMPIVGMSDDASVLAAAFTLVSSHVTSDHRDRAKEWMAHERLV